MSNSPTVLKKLRICIVALFLAALSVGISPNTAMADRGAPWDMTQPADYYVIVTNEDGVNIRENPDQSTSKVGFAPYGTRLHVTGTVNNIDSGTWLEVDYGFIIASAAIEESQYVPPAPATTESVPAETTPEQTPTTDQSTTAKAQGTEQSSQKSGISKGLVIALVAIVAVICIISILLLYLLFVRQKKTQPGSPATPW